MPYKVKKQKCKQSDGKSGSYVLQKKKSGKWEKASCHASKEKADAARRARGMHENSEPIKNIRLLIREIIKESEELNELTSIPLETIITPSINDILTLYKNIYLHIEFSHSKHF